MVSDDQAFWAGAVVESAAFTTPDQITAGAPQATVPQARKTFEDAIKKPWA
jgi:hypothetical protein